MTAWTEHRIATARGEIAAVDHGGQGPDVVLIHGGNRTLLDWTPLRSLMPTTRHIAYDLRGHGRSSIPPDGDYSFEGHEADLRAVVEHFGASRPLLVGHSIGGNVAVSAAASGLPVSGVVSLDGHGPGVYDGADRDERQRQLNAEIYAALPPDRVADSEVDALVDRERALLLALDVDPDLAGPAVRRALVRAGDGFERRPLMSHQEALAAGLEQVDFFGLLARLTCPALIVTSDRPPQVGHLGSESGDFVSRLARGRDAALRDAEKSLPGVRVERMDAGHMLHLERPVEVAEVVSTFLARNHEAPRRQVTGPQDRGSRPQLGST